MMDIAFQNVGRNKRTWTATLALHRGDTRDTLEMAVIREVKAKSALKSQDVDAIMVDNDGGNILAGGRPVGQWRIVRAQV